MDSVFFVVRVKFGIVDRLILGLANSASSAEKKYICDKCHLDFVMDFVMIKERGLLVF